MAWEGLEPWQAILAGLGLGVLAALVYNRWILGSWNILRVPRVYPRYIRWLVGFVFGWLVFYYSALVLGPHGCDVSDPWGAWFWVFWTVSMAGVLAILLVYYRTVDRVALAPAASKREE